MSEQPYFLISEVAKYLNVSRKCILNLERKGLVKADKISDKGYRYYSAEGIALIEYMLRLKQTELTLEQINGLISGRIPKEKIIDILSKRKEAISFLLDQFEVLDSKPRFEFLKEEDIYVYTKETIYDYEYSIADLYQNARVAYENAIKEGCVIDFTKPFFSYYDSSSIYKDKRRVNNIPLLNNLNGEILHLGKRLRVSFIYVERLEAMVSKAYEIIKLNGLTPTGKVFTCSEGGPIAVQKVHIIKIDIEYK